MSTRGDVYIEAKIAEDRAAVARAARVKEFIVASDPEIISDFFTEIKEAVLSREANEVFAITKFYQSVVTILHDVEADFCNL